MCMKERRLAKGNKFSIFKDSDSLLDVPIDFQRNTQQTELKRQEWQSFKIVCLKGVCETTKVVDDGIVVFQKMKAMSPSWGCLVFSANFALEKINDK